ncbi:MAG: hypothetical protein NC078_04730 [Ruminococcus sp.]|nr:hypothetical protein [Ruminococcus sp.]
MPESIIEGMRRYIADCPLMAEFESKRRHIDWTDADCDNYGIFPDSDSLIEEYIDGTQVRQYACQITIRKFATLDADKLRNNEFLERLQRWLDKSELPELPEGCTAREITAANAMLSELDAAGKYGTYLIQIIMEYTADG